MEKNNESPSALDMFVAEYDKKHRHCPMCGSERNTRTEVCYVPDANNPEGYRDLNIATCCECLDVHRVHDRTADMTMRGEVLITFGTENDTIGRYVESEFTRSRIWNRCGNGDRYSGTLLERLNGETWYHAIKRGGSSYYDPVHRKLYDSLYGVTGSTGGLDFHIKDVSHNISNVRIECGKLLADVTILNTPCGMRLKEIVKALGKNAISFVPRDCMGPNDNSSDHEYQCLSFDAIIKENKKIE